MVQREEAELWRQEAAGQAAGLGLGSRAGTREQGWTRLQLWLWGRIGAGGPWTLQLHNMEPVRSFSSGW